MKVSLLIVLAAFGAINRYCNVPAAATSLRGLRRLGASEVAIAVVVVMVTGLLAETAPPATRHRQWQERRPGPGSTCGQ